MDRPIILLVGTTLSDTLVDTALISFTYFNFLHYFSRIIVKSNFCNGYCHLSCHATIMNQYMNDYYRIVDGYIIFRWWAIIRMMRRERKYGNIIKFLKCFVAYTKM